MARTIEQIEADIQRLEAEKKDILADHIRATKLKAVEALDELARLDELPSKIKDAVSAKDGTINLRRTFAIRG